MDSISANRVMAGTWGEMWLDGVKVAECTALQAKMTFDSTDIDQCGQMGQDRKITSTKGTGNVTMNKVFSRMAAAIGDNIRNGRDKRFTIISKLADPDAYGAERVVLKNVSFDDLTLADWAAKTPGKVEAPFTFTDFEYLDKTEVQA